MKPMEHMSMKWKAVKEKNPDKYGVLESVWAIRTNNGDNSWYVAEICSHLPGDKSGEKTARAICSAHNATLEKTK